MTSLAVAECFGPVWQGEGPSVGRRAWFLRLGGCNLACTFCDTPYTWDSKRYDLKAEIRRVPIADLVTTLGPVRDLLVITGGEPLLQSDGIARLLDAIGPREVEVETNGTVPAPDWARRVTWNVSPKLANSGNASTLHPSWRLAANTRYKFVVTNAADVHEASWYATPPSQTWIMPEGTDAKTILDTARKVAGVVTDYGFNLTLRQHVLMYGNERAR